MTKKNATILMNELDCSHTVKNILNLLNGESYSDSKKILELVNFFLTIGTFVDAPLAVDLVDEPLED